jgi:hypothetical protein
MLRESTPGAPDLYDLGALATASLRLCPCTSNAGTPEGLRMEAEKQAKNQEEKNMIVRPQSWQSRSVGGRSAVSWIADSAYSTVTYRIMVMTESPTSVVIIRMTADQKSFEELRPRFDAMIDSMMLK